jgi:predicted nucleotide-binding protein
MAATQHYVFASYARSDYPMVNPILAALRALGTRTWVDRDELRPGVSWMQSISDALKRTEALVFFASQASVRSVEELRDLEHAEKSGIPIVPVLIGETKVTPSPLRQVQWVDATRFPRSQIVPLTAQAIVRALDSLASDAPHGVVDDTERHELAKALTARTTGKEPSPDDETPTSVFVVHGHDEEFLGEVVDFVDGLGIKPVVLKNMEGATRSLFDRFFEFGGTAQFAIVLLSADDMGASRLQFEEEEVGARALKYRPRQNTILELGYFYGLLGWDKVFVLEKEPPRRFPDFERPSDLQGVLFDRYDAAGAWKKKVAQRLERGGFKIAQKI